MARKLALLASLAAVAAVMSMPAGATAAGGLTGKLAANQCVAKKSEIGKKRFAKKYGAKPMPACIKKGRPAARRAVATATADCQAEIAEWGIESFYEDWSSFNECVEYYADAYLNGGFEEDDEIDDGDGGEEEEEG
jgi:hypothetical protein